MNVHFLNFQTGMKFSHGVRRRHTHARMYVRTYIHMPKKNEWIWNCFNFIPSLVYYLKESIMVSSGLALPADFFQVEILRLVQIKKY